MDSTLFLVAYVMIMCLVIYFVIDVITTASRITEKLEKVLDREPEKEFENDKA